MSGQEPSDRQKAASRAQAEADRTGVGKSQASKRQSEADRAAYPKHGL